MHLFAADQGQFDGFKNFAAQRAVNRFGAHSTHVAPVDEQDFVTGPHAGSLRRESFGYLANDERSVVPLGEQRSDRTVGRSAGRAK
jgi:hypothetical protein